MAEGDGDYGNLNEGSPEESQVFRNQSLASLRKGTIFNPNLEDDFELEALYDGFSDSDDDEMWKTGEDGERQKPFNLYEHPPTQKDKINELMKTMVDLTEDGTVKKKLISEGGGIKPPKGSKLIFEYTAYHEGSAECYDSATGPKATHSMNDERCELIPGLRIALESMKFTEEAQFWIHWTMAYGELGCPPRIPAKQCIFLNIRLKKFIPPHLLQDVLFMTRQDRNKLPWNEIKDGATEVRLSGNRLYNDGSYWKAIRKYRHAIDMMENFWNINDEEAKERAKLLSSCYCNMSICYLKLGLGQQACAACKNGLQQPCEIYRGKLFYRFAQAKCLLNGFNEAFDHADMAQKNGLDSVICEGLRTHIRRKKEIYEFHEKKLAKRIMKMYM